MADETNAVPYLHAIQADLRDIGSDITLTAEDIAEDNISASITILRENYKALGALLAELTGRAS